jgi:hypothetical protein
MRRRRSKLEVSTFPFLAVLLCAMGALMLFLFIMDRRAKIVVQNEARKAKQAQAVPRKHESPEVRDTRHADWEKAQAQLHQLLLEQQEKLMADAQKVQKNLADTGSKLRVVQTRYVDAQQQVAEAASSIMMIQGTVEQDRDRIRKTEQQDAVSKAELAKATQTLLEVTAAYQLLRAEKAQDKEIYSVVPYRGKRGDIRPPIYIECAQNGLVFHPEKKLLHVLDFTPLALVREVERRAGPLVIATEPKDKSRRGDDEKKGPYILFLVRPEGITNYYKAQMSLRGFQLDFGYELVEESWVLDFSGDGVNPNSLPSTKYADRPLSVPGKSSGVLRGNGLGGPGGAGSGNGPGGAPGTYPGGVGTGPGGSGTYPGGIGTGPGGSGTYPGGVGIGPGGSGTYPGGVGIGPGGSGTYPGGVGTNPGGNGNYPGGVGTGSGGSGPGGKSIYPGGIGTGPGGSGIYPGSIGTGPGGSGTYPGGIGKGPGGIGNGPGGSGVYPGGIGTSGPTSNGIYPDGTGPSGNGTNPRGVGTGTGPGGNEIYPSAAFGAVGNGPGGSGIYPGGIGPNPSPGVKGVQGGDGNPRMSTAPSAPNGQPGPGAPNQDPSALVPIASAGMPAANSNGGSALPGTRGPPNYSSGGTPGTGGTPNPGTGSTPGTGGGNGTQAGSANTAGGSQDPAASPLPPGMTGTPGNAGSSGPAGSSGDSVPSGGSDGAAYNRGVLPDGFGTTGNPRKAAPAPVISKMLGNKDFIITIDCYADHVTVFPGGKQYRWTPQNVKATDQAFAQEVARLIERRQAAVRPGETPYRPVIRFQVDDYRSYYHAYPLLVPLNVPMTRANVEE